MAGKTRKSKRQRKGTKSGRSARRAKPLTTASNDQALRAHLIDLLGGENAHLSFDKTVADFPFELCGLKPDGIPYSAWQVLEHLRIAQWDILEFSCNPRHVSPPWPQGYWPSTDIPANQTAWHESVKAFRADLKSMQSLVKNPRTNLLAKIPHGDGQTILREALLVADHNAYHIGQLVLMRRLLGAWRSE
jgi:DinB superfamily